jgi:hypothetical protein
MTVSVSNNGEQGRSTRPRVGHMETGPIGKSRNKISDELNELALTRAKAARRALYPYELDELDKLC